MHVELLTSLKLALLWLWILLAEGFYSYFLHALCLKRSVIVVGRYCCDCIYDVHTLGYLTKCCICAV